MADSKKNTTDFKEAFKAMLNDYKIESKIGKNTLEKKLNHYTDSKHKTD